MTCTTSVMVSGPGMEPVNIQAGSTSSLTSSPLSWNRCSISAQWQAAFGQISIFGSYQMGIGKAGSGAVPFWIGFFLDWGSIHGSGHQLYSSCYSVAWVLEATLLQDVHLVVWIFCYWHIFLPRFGGQPGEAKSHHLQPQYGLLSSLLLRRGPSVHSWGSARSP